MKKLTRRLSDFFLQKPVLSVLLVSVLLTLPWIGMGEFYTKGEPREASLVQSMLQDGHWVLPMGYVDEIGYKPPLMQWIIAGFSLLTGSVSEFTSRLPSALALIGMTMLTLLFLLKRKSTFEAVVGALLLLTCFELHRYSLECRVDMTLAFFMSAALIGMYNWEEKKLKGFPILTVLLLGAACLVKGPVGAVLPCMVFGVYLLLRGYSFWKVLWKNVLIALPALLILGIWYYMAYRQEGSHFLTIVFAENIGRFLGMNRDALGIDYNLGHDGPFWYYFPAIVLGFMPWSILLVLAACTFGYKKWWQAKKTEKKGWSQRIAEMDKLTLFSILVVVLFICFYAIPSSKRSVYIMPVYPFAAFLLAKVFAWAETNKPQLIKGFSYFFLVVAGLLLLLTGVARFVDISVLAAPFIKDAHTIYDLTFMAKALCNPSLLLTVLWLLLFFLSVLFTGWMRLMKVRIVIFGIFTLYIGLLIFLEGAVFPVYKDGYSFRPLAEKLEATYDLQQKGYVMNNLRYYPNLYGLNFYLGNHFKNFEKGRPSDGFLVITGKKLPMVQQKYVGQYSFVILERSGNPFNEMKDEIIVCQIIKL